MAPPISWLPPLNSHPQYDVYVKASQPGKAEYDPTLFFREFSIKIKICVNFYSDDKDSKESVFEGLSTEYEFGLFCHELNPDPISSWEIISSLLDRTFIPFDFDGALWRGRQLDSSFADESRTCCKLFDNCNLIEKISEFLCCMKLREYNAGKNKLPFKLEIEKMVTVPDQELAAWNSWYDEKRRSDPGFEMGFREAIRRPRTYDELIYETQIAFRGAAESSIREVLEAVPDDDDDPTSSSRTSRCSICLEEFLMGRSDRAQALMRLPCSHIFHGDCIVKWLQDSHMCPLCRFTLPTDSSTC